MEHQVINPAPQSLSGGRQTRNSPNSVVVHPLTMRMISDLGLRFPPTSKQDEEGRAGLLALLATDVADIPPSLLEKVIAEWVRVRSFMPKASELRNLATSIHHAERLRRESLASSSPADRANARAVAEGQPAIWAMVNGRCECVGPSEPARRAAPLSRVEIEEMRAAPAGSMRSAYFDMGVRSGWIVPDGAGGYRDSAG